MLSQILSITLALFITAGILSLGTAASRASQPGNFQGMAGVQATASQTETLPAPSSTPTITVTPTPHFTVFRYLPQVYSARPPDVELLDAWNSNPDGVVRQAFIPNAPLQYRTSGMVNLDESLEASLRWTESGPCSAGQIFSDTLDLASGEWEHHVGRFAPECTGIYSATAQLRYDSLDYRLTTKYAVNDPNSAIQFSVGHGFDRCSKPDLDDMQDWWDRSPYSVFNLYIGGISFFCKNDPVDAVWVHQAAQQGWTFILTWVGPQAPCTSFTHRMSSDPEEAYEEGREEAEAANSAAIGLGFFGDKFIYYDVEAYSSASTRCKLTVSEFMRGWVERLHELNTGAGGYGSPCGSHISDWAENVVPPDEVWLAHWYLNRYDEDASVWDTPCLSDDLWAQQQRTKQYTGGHRETWGSESMTIDSNKFEGKTVVLPVEGAAGVSKGNASLEVLGPALQDAGLAAPGQGWAVSGEHIYWTDDGGGRWRDITPSALASGRILGVSFDRSGSGLAVGQAEGQSGPVVLRTTDGGLTWQSGNLPGITADDAHLVERAYIETLGDDDAWMVLKLVSGSSFSLGRLFATQDGGRTWQERSAPLGEAVQFVDDQRGWMAGGPAGDQLYRTLDGGLTWQPQEIDLPAALVGLPVFDAGGVGWLAVVLEGDDGETLVYFQSRDGGDTWRKSSPAESEPDVAAAQLLEANPALSVAGLGVTALHISLPTGIYAVDYAGGDTIWALANQGECLPAETGGVRRCQLRQMLLQSQDGGETWQTLCGPDLPCWGTFKPTDGGG